MHGFMIGLSRAMALAGGTMLTVLVLLVCASIFGRELNEILQSDRFEAAALSQWLVDTVGVGAINGDFELLEAGMAFTIFAFIPLTQMTGGHATVDIFADRLPDGFNRWLMAAIEVVFAAILVLIAVQLWDGMSSKLRSGETTLRLQFPIWYSYALAMMPAAIAAVVACYCAWARVVEAATRRTVLTDVAEAEH